MTILPALLAVTLATSAASLSPETFRNPSRAYAPHVWWHWVDGNVSLPGITADLEAMAEIGLGGAQIFDVGSGIDSGPVKFNSPAWYEAILHAHRESRRLGLQLCLANCSGYSSSGGPWVTLEDSMKRLVVTHVQTNGVRTVRIPPRRRTPTKAFEAFYRDVAVVAFPTPKGVRDVTKGIVPAKTLSTTNGTCTFVYDFGEVRSFGAIAYRFAGLGRKYWHSELAKYTLTVETSADGENWTAAATVNDSVAYNSDPWSGRRDHAFGKTISSRFVRVTFVRSHERAFRRERVEDLMLGDFGRLSDVGPKFLFASGAIRPEPSVKDNPDAVVRRSTVVDLTSTLRDDTVTLPNDGDWSVVRIGYELTGAKCAPSTESGRGYEVDKLDRAAVSRHFDAYIGRIAKLCEIDPKSDPETRAGFNQVLVDSWEVGLQNWTAGFEKTLAKRLGRDITADLPVFAGFVVGSTEESNRFAHGFRRAVEETFAASYSDELARRCREAGLLLALEPYSGQPCSTQRYGREVQIPMSEFWWKPVGQEDAEYARTIASIAHTRGRRIVQAESFTSFPEDASWRLVPDDLKICGDLALASGVNRLVFHRSAHQPWTSPTRYPGMTMGYWGMQFERTTTWWPLAGDWIKYLTRTQYLLQEGRFVGDALYFVGADVLRGAAVPHDLPKGYACDIIGCDTLAELEVKEGRLAAPSGLAYAVLAVAEDAVLTETETTMLTNLVTKGATVVRSSKLVEALKAKLGEEPTFFSYDDEVLTWQHRTYGEGEEAWFVAKRSTIDGPIVVYLRTNSPFAPEVWDAETGAITTPEWKRQGDVVKVTLEMFSGASAFVVFRGNRTARAHTDDVTKSSLATGTEVNVPWKVRFPANSGAPAEIALTNLVDLSTHSIPGVRYFSGICVYETEIKVDPTAAKTVLRLKRVASIARVKANGVYAPVIAWRYPFDADITEGVKRAKDGCVKLEIEVANTWVNRLVGDEIEFGPPPGAKYNGEFVCSKIPDWVRKGEPAPDGRHTFTTLRQWNKRTPLPESGLIGPVKLFQAE